MGYCTVAEVKEAINFPVLGAPVSDATIETFIGYAEEEIQEIYHTYFGNIEVASTATSGTTTTIVETAQTYDVNQYIDYVVWIVAGTNIGDYRPITSNTADTLTISPAFDSAIDNTSQFRITKLGYKDETVDGTGTDFQFVRYQPLIELNALTIDSVDVTPSNVFVYNDAGRLLLSNEAEMTHFNDATPKLVNIKYVYGVYPLPQIIKRLAILLAGMRTLTAQIAGTYDDFTALTMPGITASKGEPYVNIQSALAFMQGEARGIVFGFAGEQVTADWRSQSTYRQFTLFA